MKQVAEEVGILKEVCCLIKSDAQGMIGNNENIAPPNYQSMKDTGRSLNPFATQNNFNA